MRNIYSFLMSKKVYYLLSFLVPLSILTIIFAVLKIYPLGDNALLVHDLNGQYISFFAYLRDMPQNGNNLFYSFSQILGLNMAGTVTYYLLSPFNLLFFVIRDEILAATLIILLKISLSGLAFFTFISKKFGADLKSLIFALFYALSAFNVIYSHNLMWLDGVLFLPLVTLGVDYLFLNRRKYLYFMFLSLSVFSNYYIGFMICIFSIMYFFGKLILRAKSTGNIKSFNKIILKFIFLSLAAVAINAVVIIPALFSFEGGKFALSSSDIEFFPLNSFLSCFFTGSYDLTRQHIGVNVYCGIFTTILAVLYFFNPKFSKKEKIILGTGLFIFTLSSLSFSVNLLWHALVAPAGFPNRFAFIFIFFMLILARRGFTEVQKIPKSGFLTCAGIFIIIIAWVAFSDFSYLNAGKIIYFAVVSGVFLLLLKFKIKAKQWIIFSLAVMDIGLNAFWTLSHFEINAIENYKNYTNSISEKVKYIKELDDSFYRMEKTYVREYENRGWTEIGRNDPLQFSYNGLTCFTSGQKNSVKDFFSDLGFTTYENWVCYREGNTRSMDVLFGVKYILDNEGRFSDIYENVNGNIYKNPFALPIPFGVSKDILEYDSENKNVFERQNEIFRLMAGAQEDILTPVENVSKSGFKYDIQIEKEQPLYVYIPSEKIQNVKIYLDNHELGEYFDYFKHDVVYLGTHEAGSILNFRIEAAEENPSFDEPLFYYENLYTLNGYYQKISSQGCDLIKKSSSNIEGTVNINSDGQYLLFTLPYQKGWNIEIDGKRADPREVLDTLMAVKIEKGEHTVSAKFIPPGFYAGLTVSIAAFIMVSVYFYFLKRGFKLKIHNP